MLSKYLEAVIGLSLIVAIYPSGARDAAIAGVFQNDSMRSVGTTATLPEPKATTAETDAVDTADRDRMRELHRQEQAVLDEWTRREAARRAAHVAEVEAYEDSMTAHAVALGRQRAEADRAAAEYQAAMAEWRAKVAACKAGDRSQCLPK